MTRWRPGRPRKRGAPKGNKNALKHGRYTAEVERANSRRRRKLNMLYCRIKWFLAREKATRAQRLANNGGEIPENN